MFLGFFFSDLFIHLINLYRVRVLSTGNLVLNNADREQSQASMKKLGL